MHLYPQRWNVAAQVAEKFITITYATLPMEERRKKQQKQYLYFDMNDALTSVHSTHLFVPLF